jgi:hypothetical protein
VDKSEEAARAGDDATPERSRFGWEDWAWDASLFEGSAQYYLVLAGTAPSTTYRSSRRPARSARWHRLVFAFQAIKLAEAGHRPDTHGHAALAGTEDAYVPARRAAALARGWG